MMDKICMETLLRLEFQMLEFVLHSRRMNLPFLAYLAEMVVLELSAVIDGASLPQLSEQQG